MKILIVIPSFYPAIIYGGPVSTSYYTCNELRKLNIPFKVITTNANGRGRLAVTTNILTDVNGYPVKYYNETIVGKFSWSLFRQIKKDIKEADVIHIQGLFSTPTPIALYWANKYKKKIILTPHGTLGSWCLARKGLQKRWWLNYLITPYLNSITWHATAEREKEEILKVYPSANVTVITNGTYLDEYANYSKLTGSDFALKFGGTPAKVSKIIVSMGRLQKVKGFDILIRSFNEVLKKYPDAMLFIAGEDEGERDKLIALTKQLNLSSRVIFTGMISGHNKTDFYANADVFVLPSHTENFGMVYAESLAAGTPIVASTNTPWHEVEEAGCGRWVPNTVDETTEAILDILQRDREAMRQNAVNYVQKFDWKNIALQFEYLYNSLI
jgi:glycosyltransferase involved in cell wall biosynthesis